MMSIAYIESESRKAARRAAREGLYPYTPESDDFANLDDFVNTFTQQLPFLGTHVPKGWKVVDMMKKDYPYTALFVDSSGFGNDYEPALSLSRFRDMVVKLKKGDAGVGFAIYEAGQFQVHVRVYRRVKPKVCKHV